jgi:hypothetical protein
VTASGAHPTAVFLHQRRERAVVRDHRVDLAAAHVLRCVGGALVGHMRQLHLGGIAQQHGRQVPDRADACRSVGEPVGLGACGGEEILRRLERRRRRHGEEQRAFADHGDRRERGDRVVGQARCVAAAVRKVDDVEQQDRAVVRRLGDGSRRRSRPPRRLVLDDDRSACRRCASGTAIAAPTASLLGPGRERHDDLDHLGTAACASAPPAMPPAPPRTARVASSGPHEISLPIRKSE